MRDEGFLMIFLGVGKKTCLPLYLKISCTNECRNIEFRIDNFRDPNLYIV
jgi:hypothetical protein